MNWWLVLLPVSGAIAGLIAGKALTVYFFRQLLPAQMPGLIARIAGSITQEFSSASDLTETSNINRLFPVIESHIDDFLRNRLKVAIPMIGMMIGERTISQLKEVFMKELEAILPTVMQDYLRGLPVDEVVTAKMKKLSPETYLQPLFARFFVPACLLAGLLAGLLNLVVVFMFMP